MLLLLVLMRVVLEEEEVVLSTGRGGVTPPTGGTALGGTFDALGVVGVDAVVVIRCGGTEKGASVSIALLGPPWAAEGEGMVAVVVVGADAARLAVLYNVPIAR